MSLKIEIYTDGACSGNPGKGGYGIVMKVPEKNYEKRYSQGFRLTTNNRMELLAVITALEKLKSTENDIHIYTDSKYVVDAIQKKWLQSCVRCTNKWQNQDGLSLLELVLVQVVFSIPTLFFKESTR